MRLKKLVPIVGFCAVSVLSSSAMAQLWAINCANKQCLDATTADPNGKVQVSGCQSVNYNPPEKQAQQWSAQASSKPSTIPNAYEGFGKPCLDINVKQNQVVTNACNSGLKAQKWTFAKNGQAGTIKNHSTNQCLTVDKHGTVTPAKCNGDLLQQWKWNNVGDVSLHGCPSKSTRSHLPPPALKAVFNLDVKEMFGVVLQTNAGTGYTWRPYHMSNCGVQIEDVLHKVVPGYPPIGGPIANMFVLRALLPCKKGTLEFGLYSPTGKLTQINMYQLIVK